MLDPVYIRASRAVTAQDTFAANSLPAVFSDAINNKLSYLQPAYQDYFTIMQLRRMSRITRIGMVAAIECLRDAKLTHPQAIITGTGKGSLSDTEKFIHNITEFNEGTLNPTPFIQSTYNALNGMIGLHHDSSSYNTTYVHRGFSLEHAILDAMMLLHDGEAENALVGSFEEITAEHFVIKEKMGYWKKENISRTELLQADTPGSIAGEGTFFFVLQKQAEDAMVRLNGMKLLFEPQEDQVREQAQALLNANGLSWNDLDVVLLGNNGDNRFDHYYSNFDSQLSDETHQLAFKHICGEFDTASGFALWLAAHLVKEQEFSDDLLLKKGSRMRLRNVLIYNNYYGSHHALYLLQECQ
jgi:3-oxoacyl-(acyl-carrier-protein) synthase